MTFELGINYWPRRSAMYMWREFDIGEIREDMSRISEMGFDVIRAFALTMDFLPTSSRVDNQKVDRLVGLCDAANDAGLKIVPTLIVINMSGRMWWPDWMRGSLGRRSDLFSDPAILRAQTLLGETCGGALCGHDAIRAFDLANEIDDAQRPRSRDAALAWASSLARTVRHVAPGVPIQIGAHLPSLTADNNMRIDDLAGIADEDVMHAYPLYSDVARSFLDPELVPFSCALTAQLAARDRPALMQEFGVCTAAPGSPGQTITDDFLGVSRSQYLASEDEAATYYELVIDRLIETGAAGAYAWCYGDYDSQLFDKAPFATAIRERTFGLVRADGSEKPAAQVFRRVRKRRDEGSPGRSHEVASILDVSADEYYRSPKENFERLYGSWLLQSHK
ncbi:MAG: hypothetical protein ABR582_06920 [Gemmatimonadaceae bacterium]